MALSFFFLDRYYNNCYMYPVTSKQVKSIRKALGLTQQQLADTIAASQVTVARWETGKNQPKGAYLKALKDLGEKGQRRPHASITQVKEQPAHPGPTARTGQRTSDLETQMSAERAGPGLLHRRRTAAATQGRKPHPRRSHHGGRD